MDVAALESHFGAQLADGVSCGPGTLLNVYSGSGISCGSLRARLASHSSSLWAHGFALTSGAGTKTAGMPQKVRADRFGKVANVDYVTFGPGQTVYTGNNGQYAVSGTQKVGFAIGCHEVFVDLDMQLGA
jgi:hypothetical protein